MGHVPGRLEVTPATTHTGVASSLIIPWRHTVPKRSTAIRRPTEDAALGHITREERKEGMFHANESEQMPKMNTSEERADATSWERDEPYCAKEERW